MRRFFTVIILIVFFIWILPLGAFIKPEKEKEACNGKRAICLCSHLLKKQVSKLAGKTFLKNASTSAKDQNSSTSFGPDFLFLFNSIVLHEKISPFDPRFMIEHLPLISHPIEHVPKV